MPIIAVVLIGNSSNVAKRTSVATASDFIHVYDWAFIHASL